MNLKPLGERVLVKLAKKEEKTKGGLYIPDTAKEEKKILRKTEKNMFLLNSRIF